MTSNIKPLQTNNAKKTKVAIICGGISGERGISLNSARSVMDHLGGDDVEICPLYVDQSLNFYEISPAQLYANTPSDFDFKLLTGEGRQLDTAALTSWLQEKDMVFPVIHGAFGEDGQLQALLESAGVPYIGPTQAACEKMFHKYNAAQVLQQNGYKTLRSVLLSAQNSQETTKQQIEAFFNEHALTHAVAKPVAGGSSIGVFNVESSSEAAEKAAYLFDNNIDKEAILEPFCQGREFTVCVIANNDGEPVAFVPSEIEIDNTGGQIFDYRRKYLPTANTKWHCPPRFADEAAATIQQQAEEIFKLFGMRDFSRLDGWLLDNGDILFTDLNPISGLEQNSFIFQQAARLGLSHADVLRHLLALALKRQGQALSTMTVQNQEITDNKSPVHVLFGGTTAERQVSLMSGTNVWLKLRQSDAYHPEPFFLDENGDVWHLPYAYALSHSVEEILQNCQQAAQQAQRMAPFVQQIRHRLGLQAESYTPQKAQPVKMTLDAFIQNAAAQNAFVFLGLHGGAGEDGTLQQKLDEAGVLYNGSGAEAAALCMDKACTGGVVDAMAVKGIRAAPKKAVTLAGLSAKAAAELEAFWQNVLKDFGSDVVIIKPRSEGCSAGVIRLYCAEDLHTYACMMTQGATYFPPHTFTNQPQIIEAARSSDDTYLLEAYIQTDPIQTHGAKLAYKPQTGWVELTVGVLEKDDQHHSLSPSITVATDGVLSLEEKFQGGTGVNLTPPPPEILSGQQTALVKQGVCRVAQMLGIENYARIDVFFNTRTQELIVIEANTLPGLTPSTVIYHQALAEQPPLKPTDFLSMLIHNKQQSRDENRLAKQQ